MLNKIEDGSGVKAVVMVNGKPETFVLAVIAQKGFLREGVELEYGFVNTTGTKYTRGMYTGGSTGFGTNDVKEINAEWLEGYRIVTTDLDGIIELAKADEERVKREREEAEAKQFAKVDRINALPKSFPVGNIVLDAVFELTRNDASFNPRHSSRIQGIDYVSFQRKDQEWCRPFNPFDYKAKDGKLLSSKFTKEAKMSFGEELAEKAVKTVGSWALLLSHLIEQKQEVLNQLRNA
jgi:hypothetical protein